MKRILLCCSAGFSTSILMKKMYDYFDDNDIDIRLEAVPLSSVASVIEQWDMVLVAPQMSYGLSEIQALTNKPVALIPSEIYQNGNGKDVALMAMEILKNEI